MRGVDREGKVAQGRAPVHYDPHSTTAVREGPGYPIIENGKCIKVMNMNYAMVLNIIISSTYRTETVSSHSDL